MQLLRGSSRRLLLVLATLLVAAATASEALAHPAETNEHGVNESVFPRLWAGDTETTNVTALNATDPDELLVAGTDVPLDEPPASVRTWNDAEFAQLNSTGKSTVRHPRGAPTESGEYVKDATVAIFAIQPSTRAHLAPGETPLYVPPNGTVQGLVDYRVAEPADDTEGDDHTYWSLQTHQIESVSLSVDGSEVAATSGTQTPELSFDSLRDHPGRTHTLTLSATITVQLQKRERVDVECEGCPAYRWYMYTPTETVTVETSTTVHEYALSVSGYRARYPNGDLGLVVYKNEPWYGYSLPSGGVRGVWRYYVARDQDWDQLTSATGTGSATSHSPGHPLQVHAYPIEAGPTPAPRRSVDLLDVYGRQRQPASLSPNVHLDTVHEPYTSSYGLAARIHVPNASADELTATGLVRNSSFDAGSDTFATVPIRESNLTLSLAEKTNETLTVAVLLRDNETGAPIATASRDGYVVVNGERLNTSSNGTVQTTVPRTTGTVAARYDPGKWWLNIPGYVGDSDVLRVQSHTLQLLRVLYRLAIPIGLLLVAGFLIDRITSWGFWPPWRNL
ncbi:hypothetical protein VB773_19670 [Haloarculaceae archaeon H-GB2-1]|nr:hypothetical protein [Haloarculaceae archaeon H-GB1-1]MEA5409577.1 hypothetical protein [Haloarculaceae archaeon H-GB2-1]